MGKKQKIKMPKIKKQRPLSTIGALSVWNGILSLIACVILFTYFFFVNDSFFQSVSNMDEGLLVLLFIFILCALIIWGMIKLLMGGMMMIGLWLPAVLNLIAGSMIKKASANVGNIYSNKSNRRRVITAIVLWAIGILINGLGIYLVYSMNKSNDLESLFIKILGICMGVSVLFMLICIIVASIDYGKKKKLLVRDANGEIVDETYMSSNVLSQNDNTQRQVEQNISGENQTKPESEYGSEWLGGKEFGAEDLPNKVKVGDITPQGKVIGFNVNTGEPIYMPVDR